MSESLLHINPLTAIIVLFIAFLLFRAAVVFYFNVKKGFILDTMSKAKELNHHGKEKEK